MKKILLLGTLLLSVSALANEAFECRAGGDLGDIFCWGGKYLMENTHVPIHEL